MIDINYSRNVYEQAMAEEQAKATIVHMQLSFTQQSFLDTTVSLQQILD